MRRILDCEHFVFDLYGTLIDVRTDESSPRFWETMARWYSARGAEYAGEELANRYCRLIAGEEETLRRRTGCVFPEIDLETVFWRLYAEKGGEGVPASERARFTAECAETFRRLSRERLASYPYAAELLRELKARGKKVYLLSNAQAAFTIPELEECGLSEAFDDRFLSSQQGVKKPDPAFLERLMQKHGMRREDTVLVGNDPASDIETARVCGVYAVWIDSDGYGARQKAILDDLFARGGDESKVALLPDLAALLYALPGESLKESCAAAQKEEDDE